MSPFWSLERLGDRPCIYDTDRGWISYARLAAYADEIVGELPARSLFALQFTNTLNAVAVYVGALRHGHVALLLDAGWNPAIKSHLISHFGVGSVFDGARWQKTSYSMPTVLHPALGLLLSTSGSTGSPKLVRLSRENLQANASSIVAYMGLTMTDQAITSLPLHYSYGLSVLNTHLLVGGSIVLTDEPVTSARFWEEFQQHRITGLAGVPTTWRFLRRLRFEKMALPSLRLMTQAGGRLDPEEVRWLANVATTLNCRLFVMYGQTEATARISYLPPEFSTAKAGSIGIAVPGGRLRLLDRDGEVIEDCNLEGELAYSGPNVMLGYAQSAADFSRGAEISELRTGDLARRDSDGHYWITGRLNRFVKIFGNRFSLDDIEQHLRASGLEAAAVGMDDCLMIGLVAEAARAEALRGELAAYYRIHASAIRVTALADLPRNGAGKVLHMELQKRLCLHPTS